jgi:hypothetical protein
LKLPFDRSFGSNARWLRLAHLTGFCPAFAPGLPAFARPPGFCAAYRLLL